MEDMFIKFYREVYRGNQYIKLDKTDGKIIEECKQYFWEEKEVYNFISTLVDETISTCLNSKIFLSDDQVFGETGLVSALWPYQKKYNHFRNKKVEYINRLMYPTMSVEDGSIDTENLEEEGLSPGKVLVYRQGSSAPQFLTSIVELNTIEDEIHFNYLRAKEIKEQYLRIFTTKVSEGKNNE